MAFLRHDMSDAINRKLKNNIDRVVSLSDFRTEKGKNKKENSFNKLFRDQQELYISRKFFKRLQTKESPETQKLFQNIYLEVIEEESLSKQNVIDKKEQQVVSVR